MTSSILSPRRLFALCSPRTHRKASTMLLLPHPFGPTIQVQPWWKEMGVRSEKDLNPLSSICLILMRSEFCLSSWGDGQVLHMQAASGKTTADKNDPEAGISALDSCLRGNDGFGTNVKRRWTHDINRN